MFTHFTYQFSRRHTHTSMQDLVDTEVVVPLQSLTITYTVCFLMKSRFFPSFVTLRSTSEYMNINTRYIHVPSGLVQKIKKFYCLNFNKIF